MLYILKIFSNKHMKCTLALFKKFRQHWFIKVHKFKDIYVFKDRQIDRLECYNDQFQEPPPP